MKKEEAEKADEMLGTLLNKTEINREFQYGDLSNILFDNFENNKIYFYLDLFIADGMIDKYRNQGPGMIRNSIRYDFTYVISAKVSLFLNFNGGYCEKFRKENAEKRKELLKYWFDILKDIIIIILSILAIFYSS